MQDHSLHRIDCFACKVPLDVLPDEEESDEIDVVTVTVFGCTDLRMRAEAMARVQGALNPYLVLSLGRRHETICPFLESVNFPKTFMVFKNWVQG
eukprot:2571482-Pleurochrysis_carterae.AAC.1